MRFALPVVVGLLVGPTAARNEEQDTVETNVETGLPTRKVKVHQFMLPEKNTWSISNGKKKICEGGPYTNWYAEAPTDCKLPTGSYSITCCDTRSKEGWTGGHVLIEGYNQKLCKNFKWNAGKECYKQKFSVVIPTPKPTPVPTPKPTPAPVSGKKIGVVAGWEFYAVDALSTNDAGVKAACLANGFVTPCAGSQGCQYNGGGCTLTSEQGCGNPMMTIANTLFGVSPIQAAPLKGVYAYMGEKWSGNACGGGSGWCQTSHKAGKAFCARKSP